MIKTKQGEQKKKLYNPKVEVAKPVEKKSQSKTSKKLSKSND